MANCLQACHGSDLILATTPTFFLAQAVAEKLHLPMCGAYLQPIALSRHQPNFLYPELPAWLPGVGIYNLVTHALSGEFLWQYARPALNRARRKVLGLPSLPFLGPPLRYFTSEPMLHGYSPAVVPKPSDWGQDNRVTGYWFLDDGDNFKPPRELTDFLAGRRRFTWDSVACRIVTRRRRPRWSWVRCGKLGCAVYCSAAGAAWPQILLATICWF